MRYEASLQPSRNAVLRGACKTRENGRAKRREGIRSAKIKNSTARFKTRAGVARWVFLGGADRPPLSEGGRDARGRKGEVGESLRERGAAVTEGHRHHSPAAAGSSLTARVSQISAPGGAGPSGQCREAARSPLPGQGGASSHLEEPGELLLGTFPPAPGSAARSLGCFPKDRTRAAPSSRRLRAARSGGAEQRDGQG